MKQFACTLLIIFLYSPAFAQVLVYQKASELRKKKREMRRPANCPDFYVSLSTGYNNNIGLGGFTIDAPVSKRTSVEGGCGFNFWGFQAYAGAKRFAKRKCLRGWAWGGGVTYNSGLTYQTKIETINGNQQVELLLHSQVNVFAAGYYYWTIGKKYNRFFVELGGSLPLVSNKYQEEYGDPLSDKSKKLVNLLAPGGPIAAIGFSFGIYN